MQGTVKFFNRKKGFGFISGEDGKDYFVHFTGLAKGTFIRDNDIVSFDSAEGDRGLKAENVQLVKKASESGAAPQGESGQEKEGEAEEQEEESQEEEQEE
ncbi:cold shock domain-containing protein [Candidatus Woesearchaeota archaeon]|nr:cold shock domain-containing protein [Candidatus Woesearchaeota archaeon]